MIRYNFSMFSCRSLGDGNSYLTRDTSIQCWTGQHLTWTLGVALPGIIIWGLTAPLVAAFFMSQSKGELKNPVMVAKYGFIYKGFKNKYYYWEIYIVFRKIALISVAVFLYQINRVIQALVCFTLILMAYRLHELHRPYVTRALNALEVRSLAVGLVTIYCGLYFLTEEVDRTTQIVLLLVLIISNLYFLIYWLAKVVEKLPDHLKKTRPRLYEKLPCLHRFTQKEEHLEETSELLTKRKHILPSITKNADHVDASKSKSIGVDLKVDPSYSKSRDDCPTKMGNSVDLSSFDSIYEDDSQRNLKQEESFSSETPLEDENDLPQINNRHGGYLQNIEELGSLVDPAGGDGIKTRR